MIHLNNSIYPHPVAYELENEIKKLDPEVQVITQYTEIKFDNEPKITYHKFDTWDEGKLIKQVEDKRFGTLSKILEFDVVDVTLSSKSAVKNILNNRSRITNISSYAHHIVRGNFGGNHSLKSDWDGIINFSLMTADCLKLLGLFKVKGLDLDSSSILVESSMRYIYQAKVESDIKRGGTLILERVE